MNKVFKLSTIIAGLLAFSALHADALKDSVAEHSTKSEAAAKAKVEEANDKLLFETKTDADEFKKEALSDEAKRVRASAFKEAAHHQKNFKTAPKEIIDALHQTLFAIDAIEKNEIPAAKDALKKATRSFDAALKNSPQLKLVPVANEIVINAFEGDASLIKKAIKTSIELLKDYDTQAARSILLPLKDEIIVTTEYIPMDLYPVATKKAEQVLEKGKKEEAEAILTDGLGTMVVDTIVIPLPLLTARDLVIAASNLDKSKKKEAKELLNKAQNELQKALLLGYTKKHSSDYKTIKKEIKKIKKEIKGENRVEKLYRHIKESFEKLLEKTRKDITRNRSEARVKEYEKKQQQKALREKALFKEQAIQETKKTVK